MIKKWLLRLSVLMNVLVVSAVIYVWRDPAVLFGGFLELLRTQVELHHKTFPVKETDVVFLGDSITHAGPWEEMFPSISTRNRGISGDTTADILDRLDQTTAGEPIAVFLKIGTNDLTSGPEDREVSYRQYQQILERIRLESPVTRIFVQSILPRGIDLREEVESFNQEIQMIASEMGVTYIDLYPLFLAEDGSIIDDVTYDELHLNARGYKKWQEALEPYIESL